jgi:hypothetical protein
MHHKNYFAALASKKGKLPSPKHGHMTLSVIENQSKHEIY